MCSSFLTSSRTIHLAFGNLTTPIDGSTVLPPFFHMQTQFDSETREAYLMLKINDV